MELIGPELLLVVTTPTAYQREVTTLLAGLLRRGGCIYVSVNQPCDTVQRRLRGAVTDAELENLFCIDCVSKPVTGTQEDSRNRVYVSGPSASTDLSIAIEQAVQHFADSPSGCRLVFDALSTLLIYNQENHVAQFTHTTVTKLRMRQIGGVFIVVDEKKHGHFLSKVVPFFDSMVSKAEKT